MGPLITTTYTPVSAEIISDQENYQYILVNYKTVTRTSRKETESDGEEIISRSKLDGTFKKLDGKDPYLNLDEIVELLEKGQ